MLDRNQMGRHAAVALAAAGLMLFGCERKAVAPASTPPDLPLVAPKSPPLPPPTLGRAEVLAALDAASSAYAAGLREDRNDLAGRRFTIRQPFGCLGSVSSREDGLAHWSWEPRRQTIEISLRPADWTLAPDLADVVDHWEAIEGFWLARPWLRTEACPAARPRAATPQEAAERAAPEPQTAGLAAVFARGGSRLGRRDGRAFSSTIRDEPQTPPVGGYRLVLEGRFTAFPGGRAIRCHSRGPDNRPVCIAAAEVDRVAFEDAAGKLISEWRPG
jgi:hypothetical protein